MAEAETTPQIRPTSLAANPWLWMLIGLTTSILALVWVRLFQEQASLLRFLLLITGILSAATAVTIRLNSSKAAYLDELPRSRRRQALLGLLLTLITLIVLSLGLLFATTTNLDIPWETGGVILLNVVVIPIVGAVSFFCYNSYQSRKPLGKNAESAALLILASLCAFLCAWALYLDNVRVENWDTMRWFLAVVTAVSLLAAGIVLLPQMGRRIVISTLILIHFGGIMTAVLAAPPTPWIFHQIWARVYRPYLQFMYLNNSYHFYAPEPGPSSFLWFRIEYQNAKGDKHWRWMEVPKVRPDGTPDYPMSLLFQRHIAMNDQVQFTDPTPGLVLVTSDGRASPNPIYYWRKVYSEQPPEEVLGKALAHEPKIQIPFHPQVTMTNQYKPPNNYAKKLLQSFAYHVFQQKHPDAPEDKVVSVKIYRVVHIIPTPEMIRAHIEPTNPILYQPYYMGQFGFDDNKKFRLLDEPKYDPDGNLLSGDPLLYWLIPILPDNYEPLLLNQTTIRGHVYRHAGDRKWIWYPGEYAPQEER